MKNLIFQYYIPYESFDADMGGKQMPEWAHAGSRSAKAYAEECDAEYIYMFAFPYRCHIVAR